MKRLKREIKFIGENIPVIVLGAFICCIGGIMLWVSGGSEWYYIKSIHAPAMPPLALVFIAWLVIYGLCGVVIALACISASFGAVCRSSCSSLAYSRGIWGTIPPLCAGFGYLMSLLWYALFFCTRLTFFGIILLVMSFIAFAVILVVIKRTFFILSMLCIVIDIVTLYFICFSFSSYLLI